MKYRLAALLPGGLVLLALSYLLTREPDAPDTMSPEWMRDQLDREHETLEDR